MNTDLWVPDLVREVFGSDVVDETFHGYEYPVAVTFDERIVSYVGVTDRIIDLDGHEQPVAGIGFVCTDPHFRGRGHMTFAMDIAHTKAQQRGLSFALLWTGTPAIYEHLDYRHAANLPDRWLVRELSEDKWPETATVDLRGTW